MTYLIVNIEWAQGIQAVCAASGTDYKVTAVPSNSSQYQESPTLLIVLKFARFS